ncbi:MAG: hypothetical protein V7637_4321 [Mycobacteriales bacterium]
MSGSSPARTRPWRSPRFWRIAFPGLVAGVLASLLATAPQRPASAADSLISQDRPVTSSSTENGGTTPQAAVDGDPSTRWSSVPADPQWLQVDLGGTAVLSRVVLRWETAYAQAFQVQVSPDAATWTPVFSTSAGAGGTQDLIVSGSGRYVRMYGTVRGTGYGYSLFEFQVYGAISTSTTGYVLANPQVTGVTPSMGNPPHAYFHEFQADCAVSRSNLPDDPIVFFGQPGASHSHTFMGNTTTNAATTLASLQAGGTACLVPGDKSAYWMPTMFNGDQPVMPVGPQVIYYKTNLIDYTSVRPFPLGLRFVVGSPTATSAEFLAQSVEGWECGESFHNADFPVSCPAGTQLNVRFQAPSCWDGKYLDTPDHKSHMSYPVNGRCTADHPVALPMIEFKMAFPVSGNLAGVRLASGRGYSFHYDFYNAWDPATQAALVNHCVVGGLQCDARGFDQAHPEAGAALNEQYQLP